MSDTSNRRLQRLVAVPPGLDRAGRRWFVPGLVIYPVAGVLWHATFVFVFWWLGVPLLSWINVASALVYVVCTYLHYRTYLLTAWAIALVEVVLHAGVTTMIFGFEAGFHFYIIIPTFAFFMGPARSLAVTVAGAIFSAAAYVGLYFLIKAFPPARSFSEATLDGLFTFNIVSLFVLLGAAAVLIRSLVDEADRALEHEHARSEALLLNVLPRSIAGRLKEGEEPIADRFEEVTILFVDIVAFTSLSASAPPDQVVHMLNEIFTLTDRLADEHGLEKIKTIGDAYMVVAGLPEPRPDHAEAMARFALALREALKDMTDVHDAPLRARMGIHSGPVVAGVIGERKFSYDLWGDSVNMAARMESHGLPDAIQVSEATFALIEDGFVLSPRGTIDIKGKGPTPTWLLEGRKERGAPSKA